MKFTFEILPERKTIFARYEGKLTLDDLLTSIRQIWADPRYSTTYDGLLDISDGSFSVDLNDVRALVAFLLHEPSTTSGRWAAVATTPLSIACSLLYRTAMRCRHDFAVFSTWEAACDFVHFDPALLPPGMGPAGKN